MLKNIRINQIIKKNSVGIIIDNNSEFIDFLGTNYFLLAEKIAPINYIKRVKDLNTLYQRDTMEKLGIEFRFHDDELGPIGMFKGDMFVGIVFPLKVKEV
jgi:hypothetical protein